MAQIGTAPNESDATGIPLFQNDPYKHLDHLGHGAYGYVDKVSLAMVTPPDSRQPPVVWARKVIRISPGWNREAQLQSARNEFMILSRLRHRHIVSVLNMYQYKNRLNIIMGQTERRSEKPDASLDWLPHSSDRLFARDEDQAKDIKPANILIMEGQVLLADFGISKDLIDQETAASISLNGDVGTRMYSAPEVLSENHRRGRAADIYSLGCVFLELCTVLLEQKGSLERWSRHRELGGSRVYSDCSPQILQWLEYLNASIIAEGHPDEKLATVPEGPKRDRWRDSAIADLAFLMLDPDPRTRITARQMVAQISSQEFGAEYLSIIKQSSCNHCREFPVMVNPNLPLHSCYKSATTLRKGYPLTPHDSLYAEVAPTWEDAKKLWLRSHMWW